MSLNGINIAVLSGVGSDLEAAIFAPGLTGGDLGNTTARQDLDKLYEYLVSTRNSIRMNPKMVSTIDDPQALLKMLDYAIEYWHTDKRDEALSILEKNEEQLNMRNGFSGLGAPQKIYFVKGTSAFFRRQTKSVEHSPVSVTQFWQRILQNEQRRI